MSVFADNRVPGIAARRGLLLHHTGRVLTYLVLALIAGAATDAVRIVVVGSTVSLVVGTLLIVTSLLQLAGIVVHVPGPLAGLLRRLGGKLTHAASSLHVSRPLAMGVVNGLLPCGVSLSAIIAAATIPDVAWRVLFIVSFGLATMPALIGLGEVVRALGQRWKVRTASVLAAVTLLFGTIVLLRGLSLDVPFLSPTLVSSGGTHVHQGCCGK